MKSSDNNRKFNQSKHQSSNQEGSDPLISLEDEDRRADSVMQSENMDEEEGAPEISCIHTSPQKI